MLDKEKMFSSLKSYRWPMYIVVCIAYMLTPFHRMAPAIMGPELIKDLCLNAVDFGLLGMSFVWAFALAQAPIGALLDKFGARSGTTIVLIMTAIGSLIFCWAESLFLVIIGRIVIAIALAGFLIGGAKIIAEWYTTKEYPTMWGLFMGLGTIGGIGATTPLQFMMESCGWRYSFVIIAVISLAVAGLAYMLLKNHPTDIGLLPADELADEAVIKVQSEVQQINWKKSFKEMVSMPKIWASGFLALGVNSSGQVLASLWGGVYLADVYNLPKQVIGDILLWSALGMVFGCVASGWFIRKIKISGVLVIGTVVFLAIWLYMVINIRTLSVMDLKVSLGILGFVQMFVISANFTLIKELVSSSQLGTAMGVVNGFTWIFGAGLFQQIWGIIINYISKGIKPYPVDAFQVAMWIQVVVLVISVACAFYFAKILGKPVESLKKQVSEI
ncbi:MAG: phosphoglycerate transporter family protein [Firmicutes bacterium]|nr:phosphoglycerate transporter family protein [Bacillota bacterium]